MLEPDWRKNLLKPVSGRVLQNKCPQVGETWESEWDKIHIDRVEDDEKSGQCIWFTVTEVKKKPEEGDSFVGMQVTLLAEDIVLDYKKI